MIVLVVIAINGRLCCVKDSTMAKNKYWQSRPRASRGQEGVALNGALKDRKASEERSPVGEASRQAGWGTGRSQVGRLRKFWSE